MKNKTEIFKSYSDFCKRDDRSINGVDEKYSKDNPKYEEDNASNAGCWNCTKCTRCIKCKDCTGGIGWVGCEGYTE